MAKRLLITAVPVYPIPLNEPSTFSTALYQEFKGILLWNPLQPVIQQTDQHLGLYSNNAPLLNSQLYPNLSVPVPTNSPVQNDAQLVPKPSSLPLLPGWKPFPYGLERYWIQGFLWLFHEFFQVQRDIWTLEPTDVSPMEMEDPRPELPWTCVIHTAKVRFNCQKSGHGWTSMQGRAAFWFRLRVDSIYGATGQVYFKLYGQQCDKCNTGMYETPLWYPEEVFNALWNLYLKVGEYCYGRPASSRTRGLRSGKPLRPHRPDLCQACQDGICHHANRSTAQPSSTVC